MPYTYDPASDNQSGEQSLSFEEQQLNSIARGSSAYEQRFRNELTPSVDDLQLTEVLSKISRETNPLKREQLQAQAELLASGGVINGQSRRRRTSPIQTSDPNSNIEDSPMSTPFGQMKAKYGSELTTTLDWACNSLDQESAEVLSADLESDDIAKVEKAFCVVPYMRENGITTLKKSR